MTEQNASEVNEPRNPAPKKKKRRWLIAIFLLLMLFCLSFLGFALGLISSASQNLPNIEQLKFFQPSESTQIFASDGTLIGSIYKENRTWVPISKMPQVLKDSIISIEDERFYHHFGIDFKGILRAIRANLRHEPLQGASTITQQLARGIFLSPQVSIQRKIQEALLAIQIERRFTKEEILELYLNQIYFGSSAYGVESAAHTYFGKNAGSLNLAEASMLAGLPQAPSLYSPKVNFKLAKERQALVLQRMVANGYISFKKAREALHAPLKLAQTKEEFHTYKYPYFTTYVVHYLFSKYEPEVIFRGGLKVYTTMNVSMQETAQKALAEGVKRGLMAGYNCHQGALAALEPKTGYIRAMVGGVKFDTKSQFNRAWQARRQPGSAFKVFVYTAAIDSGFTPTTIIQDSPISYPMVDGTTWSPRNSDGGYWGSITLTQALQFSRNVCAVRMIEKLGPGKVIDYAYRMGIKEKLEPNLSLALGSSVVTPLQMASAFGVLAHGGIKVEPIPVKLIKDFEGNVIEDNTNPYQEAVIPFSTASTMTGILQKVIEAGTGTAAQIGRPAAGKTGTTNDFRDAWFIGYTPQMAAAVWIGNDDYSPMVHSYGGDIPAGIWAKFMKSALAKEKIMAFETQKSDLDEVMICDESGLRASPGCPSTHKEMFKAGTVPKKFCQLHPTEPQYNKQNIPATENTRARPQPEPTTPEEEVVVPQEPQTEEENELDFEDEKPPTLLTPQPPPIPPPQPEATAPPPPPPPAPPIPSGNGSTQ
ncbi:MAG: penicillin-binding protein 1A [bacterium]